MRPGEVPARPGSSRAPPAPPSAPPEGRLVGLDLARGLAVLGMFAAHIGPDIEDGGVAGTVMQLTHGRSAALFALLAGVTLVIIGGRRRPRTGLDGRRARAKITVRAVVLIALGTGVAMLPAPVDVILAYYGLCFLLALPLVRLRAGTLAVIAAVLAVAGPLLSFGARTVLDEQAWAQSWEHAIALYDPLERLSHEGVVDLVLTGAYPVLSWLPYMIAGMALGRLDLRAARVRHRLLAAGSALALAGYGASWLAFHLIPGVPAAIADSGWLESGPVTWWQGPETGTVDTGTPALLLVAAPHSGTPFEIVGNLGVAITVVVCAVALTDRWARVRRPLLPVIAVGTMSLSVYVAHIVVLALLDSDDTFGGLPVLSAFIAAALVLAVLWTRHFRRGPLEHLLNAAAQAVARRLR
ncbi:DUF418 domain-containing protein [Actinomadura rugatobispora]|uniref:DUF418 domain-containing protein n=1 Tax=Actinomadura rugatobispora TaxID=1994 RepID=A0ABW1AGN7_9ACTN|nr:heparan-alpha-glucosaminide N-acetyltransferase domain-containing protein [Actinomadura rugatobispora]